MKNKNSLLWIWKNSKSQILLIIILTLSSMVVSSTYVIPALLSRRVINIAVDAGSLAAAKQGIIESAIILGVVIAAQLLLMLLNSHLSVMISGKLEMKFRHNFFETLTKKNYSDISSLHSGDILTRFSSDINIVVSGITGFIPEAVSIAAKLVSGLIVVMSFSKSFAAAAVGVGMVVVVGAMLFKPIYKKIHKKAQAASGVVRGFTQECVENIVVVKTFSSRMPLLAKLDSYMKNLYKIRITRNHISNIAGGGVSIIFTASYYGTLCWGAYMMASGNMDYGTLAAFLQIVSQIQTPFLGASSLITQFYSAQASAERLMEIENMADEPLKADFNPAEKYSDIISVRAENLDFGYGDDLVIANSTFEIKKGSIVAITGPSGIGKSTLFKLMLGLFVPNSGRLYIHTDNGDINIDASTRPLFAYVPQGNLLISGTIAENIKFANPDVSDEKMIEAAKTACIYDFIQTLPNGFESKINERGGGLSEGQIQRIAVARALCSDAPILLLDECTSALDAETEENMLENISKLNTKTVFFISHKNAALEICDTHINAENGVFK